MALRGAALFLGAAAVLAAGGARADGLRGDWRWEWERDGVGDLKVGTRGIRFRTPGRNLELRIRGRLHLDAGFIDDDTTSMGDDFEVRRARLSFSARLYDDWRFGFEVDAVPDKDERLRRLSAGYTGFENVRIRAGILSQRLGLEGSTSSNDITFMERSLAYAHSPSSFTGGDVRVHGGLWSARIGGFFESFGDEERDKHMAEGPLVIGRFTLAPFHQEGRLLHLGASALYRNVTGDDRYRLRTRPESSLGDRIFSTGRLKDVDEAAVFGAEAAAAWGPFSVQGEYLRTELWRDGTANPSFDGGYVQASWFPTGESRPYSVRRGGFTRIEPLHRFGAVELAVRWSTLDLVDAGVAGGESDNITAGLNWYLNRNIRLMFNFVNVDGKREGDLESDDPKIFQWRFQLAF